MNPSLSSNVSDSHSSSSDNSGVECIIAVFLELSSIASHQVFCLILCNLDLDNAIDMTQLSWKRIWSRVYRSIFSYLQLSKNNMRK